jgi:hypothetical protein
MKISSIILSLVLFAAVMMLTGCIFPYWDGRGGHNRGGHHGGEHRDNDHRDGGHRGGDRD